MNFFGDEVLISATERKVYIIGEALNAARQLDPALESRITDLRRIVGMRNMLAHAYHAIDPERLYQIARDHVPLLAEEIAAILDEDPAGPQEW